MSAQWNEKIKKIDPSWRQPESNRFAQEVKCGATAVEELLIMMKNKSPSIRADAAEALGLIGDTRALAALRVHLADRDSGVRVNVAVALIRVGDSGLFPEIVKALRHEDPKVVVGAALALGRLGDRRVVPNLVEAFKTQNLEIGAAVAWALGQCKDPASLPWLIAAVEQGFSVANACEALGRIGDVRAKHVLLRALSYSASDVRAYAARALAMLSWPAARSSSVMAMKTGALQQDAVNIALKRLLKDTSSKVRLCASLALYELGEKSAGRNVVKELEA
jgi:HEAT repeat protein